MARAFTQRDIHYFIVNNSESLQYVVNLGTIPLHVWPSRLSALDRPDWLVLDLDPKGAPFTDVVRVARMFRQMLNELGLVSCVKTSGATGLHILLPMASQYTHEECRSFARLLAIWGQQRLPDIATVALGVPLSGPEYFGRISDLEVGWDALMQRFLELE